MEPYPDYNSAYVEGWARDAEALSAEMGLLESTPSRILRRAWPARGMVADAGLHVLRWTPEQAADFMAESGDLSEGAAWDLVDRVAAIPAHR